MRESWQVKCINWILSGTQWFSCWVLSFAISVHVCYISPELKHLVNIFLLQYMQSRSQTTLNFALDLMYLSCPSKNVVKRGVKALANKDTLLQTHCCQHHCFPVCPRAQHLLQTQILCLGHKKCFWLCSETFWDHNKCFPVCAAQETSWTTMCLQQCTLVYQGL